MNIKQRLIIMNFLQFFVWGSWLISIGGYLGGTLHFKGAEIGAVFSTLGIASLFMPAIMGIIADKWLNAERVFGLCHCHAQRSEVQTLGYNMRCMPRIRATVRGLGEFESPYVPPP